MQAYRSHIGTNKLEAMLLKPKFNAFGKILEEIL